MSCIICGTEGAHWRPSKRQTLCRECSAETPRKVSRAKFNRVYWGAEPVSAAIAREFYSDYLASTCSLAQYIRETTESERAA